MSDNQRADEIFREAIKLDADERDDFLSERCAGDATLRSLVEARLRGRIERELGHRDSTEPVETPLTNRTLRRIGPYRILQRIGVGGMGDVYEAEQGGPIRRRIAIKVVKQGMDSEQVVARFEVEQRALALMDHPNIAKVFDGGVTEQGKPFFVMEHVKGIPITAHCDKFRLSIRERLDLFVQVCDGIQHAHQKAVIHRDIKPTNILVAMQDGRPVPKIIDFGLAKAMALPLTERTLFTQLGQLIGTPAYMSPEQAEMTGQDVDTRTDVYSLGAVLYELLAGVPPFKPRELQEAGFEGILRALREREPPKPSARVRTSGEDSIATALSRRSEPTQLPGHLQGDLDWITMKALEKDRARRYGTPSELAADIGRHLTHLPVMAGPPSARYRLGRFVRRHRIGVSLAVGLFLALVGFAARERIQSERIAKERDRANREAETAGQIADFLTALFEVSDPSEARGNTVTAREILDRGAERITESLAEDPILQARLLHTIGTVYRSLGLLNDAERLITRAVDVRSHTLGDNNSETLVSMSVLAEVYWRQGRYSDAEVLAARTLALQERILGAEHPETLRSMWVLGATYSWQGRHSEAEKLMRRTWELRRRVLGDEHTETLFSMNLLAAVYGDQGRYEEAEALHRETQEIARRVLGVEHLVTLGSMNNLALIYMELAQYADAEALFRETLGTARAVLGEEHPQTLNVMSNLADTHLAQGRYEEAEALHRETLEIRRRVLDNEHPAIHASIYSLARVCAAQGQYEEAEALLHDTLEFQRRVLGDEHPETLDSKHSLADVHLAKGRYAEAESLHRETLEIRRRIVGDEHSATNRSRFGLACSLALQGRRKEALEVLREAVAHGYRDRNASIPDDPQLSFLHGDPEFEAIVEELRRRNEESATEDAD